MVTRILPDPSVARELALSLNPLILMTLGKNTLRYLQAWFLWCMALLVILSWAFRGQSDSFSVEYWTRVPRCWVKHVCISTTLIYRGNDL